MVIDCHVHCGKGDEWLDKLIAECDRLGIDKVCLLGRDNVVRAMERYPDRVIGMGYFRLGYDSPALVEDLHQQGFKGLKVIRPLANYDDKAYYPVYELASIYKMPILFHTGIVSRSEADRYRDVSCDRMRPMYLDTIARRFQDLNLIMAHFGNPWYFEAGEVIRMNPNVYFDLTGSSLKKKPPEFFKELLWWDRTEQYKGPGKKGPYEKLLFGTDVKIELMEDVLQDYRRLLDVCGVSDEMRARIMGGTAAQIFGLSE